MKCLNFKVKKRNKSHKKIVKALFAVTYELRASFSFFFQNNYKFKLEYNFILENILREE